MRNPYDGKNEWVNRVNLSLDKAPNVASVADELTRSSPLTNPRG